MKELLESRLSSNEKGFGGGFLTEEAFRPFEGLTTSEEERGLEDFIWII